MTPHDARALVIVALMCIALVWLMRIVAMTDNDYAELEAWRSAFGHIADGTPDGVANAINAQIAQLEHERDS